MLTFNQLSLRRGVRLLLDSATFTVNPGERVGITGANGCGKSSLFALIQGQLEPDGGSFFMPPGWVIAHVAQETPAVERQAIEYVMDGDRELRAVQQALAEAEAHEDGHRAAELHGRLQAIDGYVATARAARLMRGLGFAPGQEQAPVQSFSGGWRMRLNLAQALMCRSDLLLLDEPTNHLDLDAVLWLEEWLRAYSGTLLLISHDREFLDAVATRIAHIEQRALTLYSGNYSQFEVRRAALLATRQAAFEKQQREVAHTQAFVERFRAKASKAKQAQSRLKALARMQLIAPAHVDSPFHFRFLAPERLPDPLLSLKGASAGYGKPVFSGAGLTLAPGSRIGLLGPNGAGKSTLIKLLAGELSLLAGERTPAKDLRLGYFAQHQLEQLDPQATPLQHLLRLDPEADEQRLRDFLGGFGFGETALTPVAPFSGGEKARLALALITYGRPNLLLLDEPTNHLDLEMRHALTLALQEFEGAMVVVSHDRHLLRSVADDLLLVAGGCVVPFDGDLDDYRQWLAGRRAEQSPGERSEADHGAAARRARRQQEAELRRKLRPLRREIESMEKRLERLQQKRADLEQTLANPALYEEQSKERLTRALAEQAANARDLGEAEERWLELSEALEKATAAAEDP